MFEREKALAYNSLNLINTVKLFDSYSLFFQYNDQKIVYTSKHTNKQECYITHEKKGMPVKKHSSLLGTLVSYEEKE